MMQEQQDFNLDVEDDFNTTDEQMFPIQATTVNGDVTKTYNSKFTSDRTKYFDKLSHLQSEYRDQQ